MKREISMEEISDGKLYGSNDLVKADCGGCTGCSACCRGMGSSIILDPYDVHRLMLHLQAGFEELLEKHLELKVVDGIILPNLRMDGEEEACTFLNEEGRCSIHPFRPGICRLFPLGRFYESGGFQYFLQVHECPKENKAKVKVKKWLDTPNLKRYESYIKDWHCFLNDLEQIAAHTDSEAILKRISMYVLQQFYIMPYRESDFYREFDDRLKAGRKEMSLAARPDFSR